MVRGRLPTPTLCPTTLVWSRIQILLCQMDSGSPCRHLRDRIYCLCSDTNIERLDCWPCNHRHWRCWYLCRMSHFDTAPCSTQTAPSGDRWYRSDVWDSLNCGTNCWWIPDFCILAMVFLDQRPYRCGFAGRTCVHHTQYTCSGKGSRLVN